MEPERKIIGYLVKCPNKPWYEEGGVCGHQWIYKGKKENFKHYINCTLCMGKFSRRKNTLKVIYEELEEEL